MSNLKNSFLDHNIWSTILVDGSDFQTRPCDMISCIDGRLLAVEGKFQKGFDAFGMRQIRDSQIANLDAITQGCGMAFIFLNIWIPRKENRLIIWEWEEFKKITGPGTIKKKDLMSLPYVESNKQRWPVKEILTKILYKFSTHC